MTACVASDEFRNAVTQLVHIEKQRAFESFQPLGVSDNAVGGNADDPRWKAKLGLLIQVGVKIDAYRHTQLEDLLHDFSPLLDVGGQDVLSRPLGLGFRVGVGQEA